MQSKVLEAQGILLPERFMTDLKKVKTNGIFRLYFLISRKWV